MLYELEIAGSSNAEIKGHKMPNSEGWNFHLRFFLNIFSILSTIVYATKSIIKLHINSFHKLILNYLKPSLHSVYYFDFDTNLTKIFQIVQLNIKIMMPSTSQKMRL